VGEDRLGIFGLETEHVILYVPDEPGDEPAGESPAVPPFALVEQVLFDALLEGRKAARSSTIKGGYFLENGGLTHVEIFLRTPSDCPILEAATPETRSPRDLLAYSRAFDRILEETSRRSAILLSRQGYQGRLAFGKNNLDARGVGYGCHENYLVHVAPGRSTYAAAMLAFPFLFIAFLPALLLVALLLAIVLVFVGIALIVRKLVPPLAFWAGRTYRGVVDAHRGLVEAARLVHFGLTNLALYPSIRLYSLFLRHAALRPFTRHLTSFLVTRTILTGSGALNFPKGRFELSQRPELTRTLAEIVMFGRRKTVFDLKGFLYDPLAIFRPTQKLTIASGDSNLSDAANLLKVGATALVIEMIEAGETFDDLRLADPVRAFREASLEGPWPPLETRAAKEGKGLSALQIQRAYWARAKQFFAGRPPGRLHHEEILDLWGDALDRLADRPQTLSSLLDWAAKKSLLDQAVLARTNWKVFLAWGRVFSAAGLEAAARAEDLEDLVLRTPRPGRRALRRLIARLGAEAAIDPAHFDLQREVHFQARKIDLRFHELGGGGYQRALEEAGVIQRITGEEAVLRAMKEPPQDTRARIRGHYIRRSARPESLHVSWNEIEISSPPRRIPTPDPFHHRLPLE
jgi:proteasome accessory factor A